MMMRGPCGLRLLLASCTALTALSPIQLHANPQGGTVVAGQAGIETPAQGHLVVRQGSARAVIDWRSFSIGQGEHTQFIQPSTSSVALNRVTGPDPSVIAGRLSANGRIVVQNEAGVTFSEGAQVNAASILATTSRIDAARLMATGEVAATLPGRVAGARVENQGEITVADTGVAALVGPEVRNAGRIVAREGRVVLGGAETYTIDLAGDGLVAFEVRDPVSRAPSDGGAVVVNTGTLEAPGGQVVVSARAARGVVDDVIFAGGRIAATAVHQQGGTIVLGGGDAGAVTIAGTLDVSGQGAGQRGGTVDVRGERIAVRLSARIDASGRAGGGTVRLGGDLQGQGPGQTSRSVIVDRDAAILADATGQGDGGTAIIWSDETTRFWGRISARGGPEGGDGGFAEVSSKGWLDYRGVADLRATLGRAGVLLLDPADLRIANAASSDVTGASPFQPVGDVALSILDVGVLEGQLAASDVIVQTVGSTGGGTGLIEIDADIAITSGRTLTLTAAGGITLNGGRSIGTGGSAVLVMQSGRAGAGGGITLSGSIALGGAGRLELDALGGGTGPGGAITQPAGTISANELLARAAGGVSLTSAAVETIAGSAGGAFGVASPAPSMAVGTVGGVAGISAPGQTVGLSAGTSLTISQAINAGTGVVNLVTGGAGGLLTVDATVTAGRVGVSTDRIAVNAPLGAGATDIDIVPTNPARSILVGAGGTELSTTSGDSTTLAVNQDEFNRLGSATAAVRLRTTGGTITVQGSGAPDATGLDLGSRRLTLQTENTSAAAIGQDRRIIGGAGSALAAIASAGGVMLSDPGNGIPTLAGRAGGPGSTFTYVSADGVTVGTVQGGAAVPSLSGIVTGGAPVSLTVNGALAVDQPVSAPGAAVSITNTSTAPISQSAVAPITAATLTIQSGGPALLAASASQVGSLVANTDGGLQFTNQQNFDVAVRNTGGGAVGITGQANLTLVDAGPGGPDGARNEAGSLALVAGGTLSVDRPIFATGTATLGGAQVTVNDTVVAPTVVAAADALTINPITGVLGDATVQRVVLRTRTAGRPISLGGVAPGALVLDAAQFDRIGVGAGLYSLRVGSLGGAERPGEQASGTLTIRGVGAPLAGRDVTLEAGIADGSGVAVTQQALAPVIANSLIVRSAAGSVLLAVADNQVGALAGATLGANADFEFASLGTLRLDQLAHGPDAPVAGVTATRTVRLRSSVGTVEQTPTGRIVAQSLVARATNGAVDLTGSGANSVGTIAGDAVSGFRYRDAGSTTVGAVAPSLAFPGLANGLSVTGVGAPISLIAGTDLTLAAPVVGPVVRLDAGQDLTQTAAGPVIADALLARAGRDVLLDGQNGLVPPGAPGGPAGNDVQTLAAQAGRDLWYRSAPGFTVGLVGDDPGLAPDTTAVSGAVGATGGAGGAVRLAVTDAGGVITASQPVVGQAVELAADGLLLAAPVGAAAEAVVVRPFTAGRPITLGSLFPFDPLISLALTAASIDQLGGPTTTLRFGSTGNATEAASGQLLVRGTGGNPGTGIRVNRAGQPGDARSFVLESGAGANAIIQTGPITGGASATLVAAAPAGEVRLDDTANDVGTIAGTAGTAGFRYRAGGAVTVGQSASVSVGAGIPLVTAGRDGIQPSGASLPITLLAGGNLGIARPLDAGTQTIRLQAGGALTQGADGTLSAGALLARGATVDLTTAANAVGVVAGDSISGFRFRNQGPLTVGAVTDDGPLPVFGATGVVSPSGNAPITLVAESGTLSLDSPVNAGLGTDSIVRLRAGGTLSQGGSGFVVASELLVRANSVLLDQTNLAVTLSGEAVSQFRFSNFAALTLGEVAGDGALVDGQTGVRLGAGFGTLTLIAGTGGGTGGLLLDRPLDAGTGAVTLQAGGGANSHVQQTATGGITAATLEAFAPAGAVDLASAGAANAVGGIAGLGVSGFRFRAAGPLSVAAGGIGTAGAPLTLVSGGTLTLAGPLSAGTGTIRLRATSGDIVQTGGTISAGALALSAEAGSIDVRQPGNAFTSFAGAALGTLAFDAAGALTIAAIGADGPAESQLGVVAPLAVLVPAFAGATSTAGAVEISAGGTLTVPGTVQAGTDVVLSSTQDLDISGTVLAAGDADLGASGTLSLTGLLDAGGAATLTTLQSLTVGATGSVQSGGAATLTSTGATTISGQVAAGAGATLDAGGDLVVAAGGIVQSTGAATLIATGPLVVQGAVAAGADATLTAGQWISVPGSVVAGGLATLTAGSDLFVGGTIAAGSNAVLGAGGNLEVFGGGLVQTAGSASIDAANALIVDGVVDAAGDAVLTSGSFMLVFGSVLAGGTAALTAGSDLFVPGTVVAGADADLSAGSGMALAAGSLVQSGSATTLASGGDMAADGTVDAGADLAATSGQQIAVGGALSAGGAASLDAAAGIGISGAVLAVTDATLTAGQSLTIAAPGTLQAGGAAALVAPGAIVVDGSVQTGAGATVTSGQQIAVGGSVIAGGDAVLDAPAAISVAGLLRSGAASVLTAGGAIGIGGLVDAGTTATLLAGQSITVPGGVAAGLDAVLDAATTLTDLGTISAGRDVLL
ncbi:two-partner secretion domain-containing protein, partial [Elioraea sp.]|uniref:two-partner secretion domain-containing protein n=1 Tax=Elioraea sp. TaxID=2185103 RepID=UPI003F6ED505